LNSLGPLIADCLSTASFAKPPIAFYPSSFFEGCRGSRGMNLGEQGAASSDDQFINFLASFPIASSISCQQAPDSKSHP
jgi:hypothetical protein